MWKVRTNEGLREIHKDLDITADMKRKRFEWIGHGIRMEEGRTYKKMFESKMEKRRRRRRRVRWREDVRKDL
jgi:hypothetical protein